MLPYDAAHSLHYNLTVRVYSEEDMRQEIGWVGGGQTKRVFV